MTQRMNDFKIFIFNHSVKSEQLDYYVEWVKQYAIFCQDRSLSYWDTLSLESYVSELRRSVAPNLVNQAEDAIKYYLFWRKSQKEESINELVDKEGLLTKCRNILRLRHRAISTERAYLNWVCRFLDRHSSPPWKTGDIVDFLTHLVVDREVSASTQNQALNALVFFYKNVLRQDPGNLSQRMRSKKKKRLPVVLTHDEI